MKILIVTQYFWPENFRINDLALALSGRGHDVTVLTGKPNYPEGTFYENYTFFSKSIECWNSIKIYRSPLIPRGRANGFRLMSNYLSFAFFNSLRGLTLPGDFEKILVYEPSPITVGLPAILMKWKKKAPIYFWVQDLWPQSVVAAGNVNNKIVISFLNSLTRWIYKRSDRILVQSEAFKEIIANQGVEEEKLIYYPNSVEAFFSITSPKREIAEILPPGFKIMFAGNIGESQDFETLIEAARLVALENSTIKWIILGDGRKRDFVAAKVKELGIEDSFILLGSFPVEKMPDFYACADCLLVSLKKDPVFSLTIPSKIQSYLACGKPILTSLDGEGSRIVEEARAGITVEAEQPTKLSEKVLELSRLPNTSLIKMGANARAYFEKNFEREFLVSKLEKILNQ